MKNQADSTRDLLYDLIMRNIEMYINAPGSQDVYPLISTVSDVFTKLVEIDNSPKGQELKQKIIGLLTPHTNLFEIIRSLATVEHINEVVNHINLNWLRNECPAYRVEAVKFISIYDRDSDFLVNLLKDEKDLSVQSAIMTGLVELESPHVINSVYDFIRQVDDDEIRLLAIAYFEKIATRGGLSRLIDITENVDNLFLSQYVRVAAFDAMKRIASLALEEND